MIVAAHQPAYLPWLGYFERIKRCDVFVFLDAVQFEKNSFTNRNQIKTAAGPTWLTVPVKGKDHLHSTMLETRIDHSRDWRDKHLRTIQQNYSRAPHFVAQFPKLAKLYEPSDDLLADLCFRHLRFWLAELGITTRLERLSALPVASRKSDLVFDICTHFGADQYLSGALGRNYLDEGKFAAAGITVRYQDFKTPVYPQLYGGFIPNLGIIDAWMNVGPEIAGLI